MEDYCTCGFRRIDQAFSNAGLVHCSNCYKTVCCDVAVVLTTEEPHAAETADKENVLCWRHHDIVAAGGVPHLTQSAAR